MSAESPQPKKRSTRPESRAYYEVAITLGIAWLYFAVKGFWFLLPAEPISAFILVVCVLVSLTYFIRALFFVLKFLRQDHKRMKAHLPGLVVTLPLFALSMFFDPYFQGARLRFWVQGGEASYLRFAEEARRKMPARLPLLSGESSLEEFEARERQIEQNYADFIARLTPDLLEHHPTRWAHVGVEKHTVTLWSGSGMIGSWGIEIHDQPDIPRRNSKAETNANPYLNRQKPLSKRVWFFESD